MKNFSYLLIIFLYLSCGYLLHSATFFVNSSADNGNQTLRQAVQNAGNNDTIRINIPSVNLTEGRIVINKNLTIIGPITQTIIDAGTEQIFTLTNGHNLNLHNLILQNASPDAVGGAIDVSNATLSAENCIFINNNATLGGAVALGNNATFRANFCLFQDNVASIGGAISIDNSTLIATDCDFFDNIATIDGGAVCVSSLQTFTATRCRFIANTSDGTGAVSLIRGTFNATDCIFNNNIGSEDAGAVGVLSSSSIFNAMRCKFYENYTDNLGGAVVVRNGTFYADSCLFEKNTAIGGGAVFLYRAVFEAK